MSQFNPRRVLRQISPPLRKEFPERKMQLQSVLQVTKATPPFKLNGNGHGRSLTFSVAAPNTCDFKSMREEQRLLSPVETARRLSVVTVCACTDWAVMGFVRTPGGQRRRDQEDVNRLAVERGVFRPVQFGQRKGGE